METVARQQAGAGRMGTFPLYQVLAEDITAMGVEAAFGLMSDDTALLVTALDTAGAASMARDTRTPPSQWLTDMPMPRAGWGWP